MSYRNQTKCIILIYYTKQNCFVRSVKIDFIFSSNFKHCIYSNYNTRKSKNINGIFLSFCTKCLKTIGSTFFSSEILIYDIAEIKRNVKCIDIILWPQWPRANCANIYLFYLPTQLLVHLNACECLNFKVIFTKKTITRK